MGRELGEPRMEGKRDHRAPKGGQREPQRVTIVIDPGASVVILEALGPPN